METQLISEKFTRGQLEKRLGLAGKDATAEIRSLLQGGNSFIK